MLTVTPKLTGEKMQPREQGEGSPRPQGSAVLDPSLGTRDLACSPLFPMGHGVWAGSRASCLQAPLPPSRD